MSEVVFNAISGLIVGGGLGIAMEKGSVAYPLVITDQMLLTDFRVLKLFMAAMGSSALVLGTMSSGIFGKGAQERYARIRSRYLGHKTGLVGNLVGGSILGVGMSVGGACPGTVLAQVGAGVPLAVTTALGGLGGAFAYQLLEEYAPGFLKTLDAAGHLKGARSLDEVIGVSPAKIGVGIFGVCITMAVLLDSVSRGPEPAVFNVFSTGVSLQQTLWSPIVAGLCFGVLQLPSLLLRGTCLGAATAYSCALAPITSLTMSAPKQHSSPAMLHLITANIGMMLGAYLSSTTSGTFGTAQGVNSSLLAIASGFLVVLGGRIAGGCTSGHGVSGTGLLNIGSFVTAAGIFGAGIISRCSLYAFGIL